MDGAYSNVGGFVCSNLRRMSVILSKTHAQNLLLVPGYGDRAVSAKDYLRIVFMNEGLGAIVKFSRQRAVFGVIVRRNTQSLVQMHFCREASRYMALLIWLQIVTVSVRTEQGTAVYMRRITKIVFVSGNVVEIKRKIIIYEIMRTHL